MSAQQDSHTSGAQAQPIEQEEQIVHTAAIGWCACTTLWLLWHLTWLSTGITARMKEHQSRCWLAAASGLSGSAQPVSGNGKLQSAFAPVQVLDVQSVQHANKIGSLSPHLLTLGLLSLLIGTLSAMKQRAFTQIRSLLAAASRCTGSAHAVQEGNHTIGEPRRVIA